MTDTAYGCWDLYKRPCRSCEGNYHDIEDGLCPGCRNESSYDEETAKAATEIIRGWKSEKTRREEAWADQYLLARQHQRRAHLAGRPGHPENVEDEELVGTRGK